MPGLRRPGERSPTEVRRVQARERERRVLELRLAGMSFERIAREVGYNHGASARKALLRALEREQEEISKLARRLLYEDLMRLDRLLLTVWPRALQGDLEALREVRAIISQRAKLLGIERVGLQISGPGGGPVEVEHRGAVTIYVPDNGRAQAQEGAADGGDGSQPDSEA